MIASVLTDMAKLIVAAGIAIFLVFPQARAGIRGFKMRGPGSTGITLDMALGIAKEALREELAPTAAAVKNLDDQLNHVGEDGTPLRLLVEQIEGRQREMVGNVAALASRVEELHGCLSSFREQLNDFVRPEQLREAHARLVEHLNALTDVAAAHHPEDAPAPYVPTLDLGQGETPP